MCTCEPSGTALPGPSSVPAVDLSQPFRGSHAVTAGLLTPARLRGPRFHRLFPDIYVPAHAEVDLELLSRAAYLLVAGRGALGGYSAAELLRASCAPVGAPAEVVLPHRIRSRPRLLVRQDGLRPDELGFVDGVVVTSPRGSVQLRRVVELSDRRAGSPMETRIRLALHFGGLPPRAAAPRRRLPRHAATGAGRGSRPRPARHRGPRGWAPAGCPRGPVIDPLGNPDVRLDAITHRGPTREAHEPGRGSPDVLLGTTSRELTGIDDFGRPRATSS